MAKHARSQREKVRSRAAAWVVRLSDPDCTPEDRAAFEAWRDESLEHEVAFEREAATWDALDRLHVLPMQEPPGTAWRRPAPVPARALRGWSERPRKALAAAAAAVLLVLGTGGVLTFASMASPAYATDVGERRVILLSDGTRMELNTDSEAIVRYRGGVRRIELVRGEAMFDVASDARPFVVEVDGSEIRANASELVVRVGGQGGARVMVTDGFAEMLSPAALSANGRAVQIAAGHEAIATQAQARLLPVSPEDIERALAWRHGEIAFNGQSLAEAVAEFNRYNKEKVVLADASLRQIRVGGYFQSHDLPGFVKAVTQAFPISAARGSDGAFYLSRESGAGQKN